MTQQEVDNIIDTLIIDNNTMQVSPAKVRAVCKAINARVPTGDASIVTAVAPLFFDEFTNNFYMQQANQTADGYLSSEDWIRFDASEGTVTEVTGTDGVTVSTGTTTPEIGLGNITPDSVASAGTVTGSNLSGTNTGDNSPNTNANGYADSKVQNTITDGVTDKAPSENAVFDALALKEDKSEYLESNGFDFVFDTFGTAIWSGGGISGGTLENSANQNIPLNRYNGVAWLHKGNASNANSGYRTSILANRYFFQGGVMFMAIRPARLTNTYMRFGMQIIEGFTPFVDASNMIMIEIINNEMRFKTSLTGTVTSSAPTILTSAEWLYIMIEAETTTSIRCRVKNAFGGSDLMNVVNTSNLPIDIENNPVLAYQKRFVLASTSTIASSDVICEFSRISHFQKKPKFLNDY